MQVIVDTNVILAMLVRPGKPIDLFFNLELEKVVPALLFEELDNGVMPWGLYVPTRSVATKSF